MNRDGLHRIILPFDDDDEVKADKVDGLLGEASHFSEKYGIYADGVSPWTASLPTGWDERLVRIEDPESGAVGLCLHPRIAVARRLPTVALRPSDAAACRRAQGSSTTFPVVPATPRVRRPQERTSHD